MRKLREGIVPTAVWGVVCVLAVFGVRAGWNAIYADWERNGQEFRVQPKPPATRISTSANVSHGRPWKYPEPWKTEVVSPRSWSKWYERPAGAKYLWFNWDDRFDATATWEARNEDGSRRTYRGEKSLTKEEDKVMRALRARNGSSEPMLLKVYCD